MTIIESFIVFIGLTGFLILTPPVNRMKIFVFLVRNRAFDNSGRQRRTGKTVVIVIATEKTLAQCKI
jgi:hypothetical protein